MHEPAQGLEAADTGHWEYDSASDRLCFSEALTHWYGGGLAKAPGGRLQDWLARVHPDDRAGAERVLRQDGAVGGTLALQVRVQRAGDDWVDVRLSGQVTERDALQRPVRLLGMQQRVPAAGASAAGPQRDGELLRTVLSTIPDPVWLKDTRGVYLACNPRFEQFFGVSEQDMVGRTDHDFVDRAQADAFRANDRAAMAAGGPRVNEERLRFADGYEGLFETTKTPMRTAKGELIGVLGIAHDITQERATQAALREAAERRRLLMDLSRDGIAIFDRDHRIIEASHRFAEMLGYSVEELLQLHTWDFEANLTEAQVRAAFADLDRVDGTFETRHRRKDGRLIDVEVSASGAVINGVELVVTVTRDIGERKAAEQALRRSEAELRQAQRLAEMGSWQLDIRSGQLRWSDETYRLFGLPRGSAVDMALSLSRVHPDDRDAVLAAWQEALVTGRHDVEHRIVVGEDLLWVREQATIEFRDGQPIVAIGTVQNITVRRLDRQRLEESEERYRILAEYSTDWEYWVGPDGRYLYVSPGCRDISGHAPKAFLDDPDLMTQLLVAEDRPRWLAHWQAVVGGPGTCDAQAHEAMEFRIVDSDGRLRWIEHQCREVRRRDGSYQGRRGVNRDITERKLAQRQLEQYREHLEALIAERTSELVAARIRAETASRAKSTFLANMSHEIRTPMNAIIGLTHLLQRSATVPAQRAQLGRIGDAARHLMGIINDILDLSKIEAGKMVLQPVHFRLDRLVDAALDLIRERATTKGIRLSRTISPELPPVLLGDAMRLSQVLLNFAGNAVKFTEQGRIHISVDALLPAKPVSAGTLWVRFQVQDTGIGIDPAQRERLFDEFEQADNSTSRRYGGTGLGLAISRRLIALLSGEPSGRIGVDSEPGRGSRFWFEIPLQPGDAARLPDGAEADRLGSADLSGLRVLLAEDNPVNQAVALDMLAEVGLRADVASDGAQAVELARAHRYDLILMDVQMPVMDGVAATQAIRALPAHAGTPIVAMTANAFDEDRRACLAAGMNDHVAKPVSPEMLRAALARWLPATPGAQPASAAHAPASPAGVPQPMALPLSVRERLGATPGLDIEVGLKSLNGRWPTYERLLRLYAATHANDLQALRERMAAGVPQDAQRLAHSLKGAAAVLGAVEVSEAAAQVEHALRADEPPVRLDPLLDTLEVAQARLIDALACLGRGA